MHQGAVNNLVQEVNEEEDDQNFDKLLQNVFSTFNDGSPEPSAIQRASESESEQAEEIVARNINNNEDNQMNFQAAM